MEKQEKNEKVIKRRCVNCNSTMTYLRLRDNSRVCRNCGFIEKIEVKKEGEEING